MKPFKIFLLSFIGFLFVTAPASTAIAQEFSIAPIIAQCGLAVLAIAGTVMFKPSTFNFHTAGVEKEAWVDYIIKRFWKDNIFLKFFFNESNKVLAGRVVHIPNPGAKPTTQKNRSVFPAVAIRRTDTDIVYSLDEYSVDPIHIQELEKIELSYDKLDDVYGDQLGALNETVADDTLIKILTGITSANILHTTGAAVPATLPGTTGNRKAAVHRDVRRANLLMNTNNVPKNDRYALLEENMADQIFDSLSDTQNRDFTSYADASTGILGKLYGFNIMTRSSIASATNADAIKAMGATAAATDRAVSLFWQKGCVSFALGEVKIFDNTDDPLYYGDIVSSLQRCGSRRRRADNLGVVGLIQDDAA